MTAYLLMCTSENRSRLYRSQTSCTPNDYSVNTVLDLNSSGGQIYGSEGIYGAIGYIGYTYPFNSLGSNCYVYPTIVPTGACNTTTSKATSATIYFNVSYGAYPSKEWLARHEIGHVWGLYHPYCTDPVTVMYSTNCNNFQTTIQADEKNWINSNY